MDEIELNLLLALTKNTEGKRKEIQHPWHPDHPLFEDFKPSRRDLECPVCRTHISDIVFGCEECKFYLHNVCAKSPPELQHPSHPSHPLKLRPLNMGVYETPCCRLCNSAFYSGEFNDKRLVYMCDNRNNLCFEDGMFLMHVDCALLNPPSKEHPSHQRPLVFIREYYCLANCAACGTKIRDDDIEEATDLYRCFECNIRIHQECVDIPIKSELHRH